MIRTSYDAFLVGPSSWIVICDKVAWNSNLASPFIVLARKWSESLVMLKFSPHSQFACPICIVTPNLEESDEVVYTLRRQHTSHQHPLSTA